MIDVLNEFMYYVNIVLKHEYAQILFESGVNVLIIVIPFFVATMAVHFASRFFESVLASIIGGKYYDYVFGIVGTPIHEIGHMIFGLIFFHRIHKVVLFTTKSDEYRGVVYSSHNHQSIYQSVGLFFVGIGPVLFGTAVIYAIVYYVYGVQPNYAYYEFDKSSIILYVNDLINNILYYYTYLLNYRGEYYYIITPFVLYVIISIGSAMSLSEPDIYCVFSALKILITLIFFYVLILVFFNYNLMLIKTQGTVIMYAMTLFKVSVVLIIFSLILFFLQIFTLVFKR